MSLNTKKAANEICGGLSKTTKMPCPSYNLPNTACCAGRALARVTGSVCSKCYAKRGRYVFPGCVAAMTRRLDSLEDPDWEDAMALLIRRSGKNLFRWHDSGDLQSVNHALRIFNVVKWTPGVRHWLPTMDVLILERALRGVSDLPENLIIRVTAPMINQPAEPPPGAPHASFVYDKNFKVGDAPDGAWLCPATKNKLKGGCEEAGCDACWNESIKYIGYMKH